eukprot:867476-Amphidinium_carterae.1
MDIEPPPCNDEANYDSWQWPSLDDAAMLVSVSISGHLESQGRSQKSIPRSLVHETLQTLHWLSTIVDCAPERVPTAIRLAAYLLLIRAPSAMWPLPEAHDVDAHGRFKPYARVRAARANLDLIHAGRWMEVLVPDQVPAMPGRPPAAASSEITQPGEMDKSMAHQLLRSSRSGRIGKAWKQLWSPGLAPGTQATVEAMAPQLGSQVQPLVRGLTTAQCVRESVGSASSTTAPRQGRFVTPPLVQDQWLDPRSVEYLPTHQSALPNEHVEHIKGCLSACPVTYMLGRFRDGTAGDILGWHSEAFRQVFSHTHSRRAVLCVAEALIFGSLPTHMAQLAIMSKVVPLRKAYQSARIRPISIPTVFRKVIAHSCLHTQMPIVTTQVAGEQYGLQRKDGCDELRSAVLQLSTSQPNWNFFKTDISNAFNSASRARLLEGMQMMNPEHAAISQHWLRVPSISVVFLESQDYALLSTCEGVPQGDPMSVMAFCLCMKSVSESFWTILQEWHPDPTQVCKIFGYIDDYVLAAAPDQEALVMQAWTRALKLHGFALNPDKTQVWSPGGGGPSNDALRRIWQSQARQDGLTLCGAPVAFTHDALQEDIQTLADTQALVPHGQDAYIRAFLRMHTDCVLHKLRALECLSLLVPDDVGAVHLVTHIIRTSVLAQSIHLMRSIGPRLLSEYMREVDEAIFPLLCRVWRLPVLTEAQLSILRAPTACGGFGIVSLQDSCYMVYTASFLKRRHMCHGCVGKDLTTLSSFMVVDLVAPVVTPWLDEETHALETMSRMMNLSVAAALDIQDDALLLGARNTLPRLKMRVHHRATVAYQAAVDAAQLAPVLTRSLGCGKTSADQVFSVGLRNTMALAWYMHPHPTGGFLQDHEFLTMGRLRLSLPVHDARARCHYIKNGSTVSCQSAVPVDGSHAHSCCRRMIMSRHGKLCSVLASLCTRAGWTVLREQEVTKGNRGGREHESSRSGLPDPSAVATTKVHAMGLKLVASSCNELPQHELDAEADDLMAIGAEPSSLWHDFEPLLSDKADMCDNAGFCDWQYNTSHASVEIGCPHATEATDTEFADLDADSRGRTLARSVIDGSDRYEPDAKRIRASQGLAQMNAQAHDMTEEAETAIHEMNYGACEHASIAGASSDQVLSGVFPFSDLDHGASFADHECTERSDERSGALWYSGVSESERFSERCVDNALVSGVCGEFEQRVSGVSGVSGVSCPPGRPMACHASPTH